MARPARRDARTALKVVNAGVRREFPGVDAEAATAMLALVATARRVDAWLQAALKPLGLADSSAAVILALALAGTPYRLSATQLNDMLVITSGGITRAVDRLAHDRIVTRVSDPGDGRRVLVQLTRRGRSVAGALIDELLAEFDGRVRLDDTVPAVLAAFADIPRPH
jgi:DNA-binding MarR family transcriptional regulator